jgi:hypothetical protein
VPLQIFDWKALVVIWWFDMLGKMINIEMLGQKFHCPNLEIL